MRSTNAIAVKTSVFNALQGFSGLSGARVSYGLPGRGDPSDTSVIVGHIKFDDSVWKTNRTREEKFRIDVLSEVQVLGGDAQSSELAVAALNSVIEDYFAGSPTFDMPSLVISDYSPGEIVSWPVDQTKYAAQVHGELTVTARF
jgi:hypothetical protein